MFDEQNIKKKALAVTYKRRLNKSHTRTLHILRFIHIKKRNGCNGTFIFIHNKT